MTRAKPARVRRNAALAVVCVASIGAALSLTAGPAAAEVRTLEAVGSVPVDGRGSNAIAHRQAAIREAQLEAVVRVADELLLGAELVGEEAPDLKTTLRPNLVDYTTRFRILEDRGERPALFSASSDAKTEYVVIVSVGVDVEKIQQGLVRAGLLDPSAAIQKSVRLEVEVRGLGEFGGYEELRRLLTEACRATRVVPLEFEKRRMVLEVESPLEATELVRSIRTHAPASLQISPRAVDGNRVQLAVSYRPLLSEDSARRVGPAGTP